MLEYESAYTRMCIFHWGGGRRWTSQKASKVMRDCFLRFSRLPHITCTYIVVRNMIITVIIIMGIRSLRLHLNHANAALNSCGWKCQSECPKSSSSSDNNNHNSCVCVYILFGTNVNVVRSILGWIKSGQDPFLSTPWAMARLPSNILLLLVLLTGKTSRISHLVINYDDIGVYVCVCVRGSPWWWLWLCVWARFIVVYAKNGFCGLT